MAESTTSARAGDRYLRGAAAALAYVVAVIHLFHPTHGFPRLAVVLSADPGLLLADPRPVAFVLSAGAILVGVPLVLRGAPERPMLVAGAVLMVVYIGGYFAWHLTGHGGFLPGREPLYHGVGPVEAVVNHLTSDAWAAAAVVTELLLLAVLLVLLARRG